MADILGIMSSAFDAFADLVRSRRTNMRVDAARTVPPDVIDRLCELARWAPNHTVSYTHLTLPTPERPAIDVNHITA